MNEPADRNVARGLALGATASQASCLMVLLVVGAVLTGMWLDAQFGTRPLIMLVLMALGIVLGPLAAIHTILRTGQGENEVENKEGDS